MLLKAKRLLVHNPLLRSKLYWGAMLPLIAAYVWGDHVLDKQLHGVVRFVVYGATATGFVLCLCAIALTVALSIDARGIDDPS